MKSVTVNKKKKRFTSEEILLDLQSRGLRLQNYRSGASGRKGGAGPSDHKAVSLDGTTVMVPVYNAVSGTSPYFAEAPNDLGVSILLRNGEKVSSVVFPKQPAFYSHLSSDGIPFWKIAQLHSHNVLATTVLQNCTRYNDKETSCQFCAIGESLKSGKTIAYKKPQHLAEVAKLAVELDNIEQFIITTGTPASADRGARILYDSVVAIKEAVNIPVQIQCEPPDDFTWFHKLKIAGADAIGMHLEAVTERVRRKIMPGKAEVPVSTYFQAFETAVSVFGRGQVSTYILAGLGDTAREILDVSRDLIKLGVYPFVVPFVPVTGTPLHNHPAPSKEFMREVLTELGAMLAEGGLTSDMQKAGCGKCGACSTLKIFEKKKAYVD